MPLEKALAPPRPPRSWRISRTLRTRLLWIGLWILLLISVGVRFYHFASGRWIDYQHDMLSHVENVEYVATHHWLAPTTEDWNEFDQAPLYYVIASFLYDKKETTVQNQANMAPLGLFISIITLGVVFYTLRYISSWLHRYTMFIFMGFMPSFILASSCIGNDGLTVLFSALSLLFVLQLNRNPKSDGRTALCIATFWGTVAAKYNGVALVLATPWVLFRRAQSDTSWKPGIIRFVLAGLFSVVCLGASLYRQYCPEEHKFIFLHPAPAPGERAVWKYMEIDENLMVYAIRFDLSALINSGQATTTEDTPDMARFSFPTWEYGNMLLGEWEYSSDPVLLFGTRQMIIAGTVLLLGLALFFFITLFSTPIWPWQKIFTINRLALLLIFTSTFLVLKLIYFNADACAADYRYQATTFSWMGYSIGRGLSAFPRSRVWTIFISILLAFFVYSSLYLLAYLYIRRGL